MQQNLDHPITPLAKLLDPVGRSLTPDVARALVNLRADPAVQERLDELADKSTEGTLTDDERAEYESYIHAIDFISVLQAQARRLLKNTTPTGTD
jgi:uncharacterized protein YnzC (UPF0291/DUF896 family)